MSRIKHRYTVDQAKALLKQAVDEERPIFGVVIRDIIYQEDPLKEDTLDLFSAHHKISDRLRFHEGDGTPNYPPSAVVK